MRSDELVFRVEGSSAQAAVPVSLAEAGLRERAHLQEWVLANPAMLGADVLVVTSEFDQWESHAGREPDRLDILGLGSDGRLVVVELKRDLTPDLVTMQAINYAARASRFSVEIIAEAYARFHCNRPGAVDTSEDAQSVLQEHAPALSAATLRNPRIVIIAGDFSPKVTTAAVWLSERGIDIALTRVQAYETRGAHIITVSQVWPPPKVEEFVVAPSRSSIQPAANALPAVPWTLEDFALLAETASVTVVTTLDLCAEHPGKWIGGDRVRERTGREPGGHRGDLAGFGNSVKARFGRGNAPWEWEWNSAESQANYRLNEEDAAAWRSVRAASLGSPAAV